MFDNLETDYLEMENNSVTKKIQFMFDKLETDLETEHNSVAKKQPVHV